MNGGYAANAASAAAAAADASAMPPPPPATPGSMRAATAAAAAAAAHPLAASARAAPNGTAPSLLSNASAIVTTDAISSYTTRAAPAAASKTAVPASAPSSVAANANMMALGTTSLLLASRSSVPGVPPTAGAAARNATLATTVQRAPGLGSANGQQLANRRVVATPIVTGQPRPAAAMALQRVLPVTAARAVAPQQRVAYQQRTATAPSTAPQMQRVVGAINRPAVASRSGQPTPVSAAVNNQPAASSVPRPAPVTSIPRHGVTTTAAVRGHAMPLATVSAPPPPARAPAPPPPPDAAGAKRKSGHPLRRGKWTSEEEAYAGRLIGEFKAGLLPLTDGTTLRNFLSKLLNCDPMRISKKFVGNNCIGKQVFRRRVADINRLTPEQIRGMRLELSELERRFFDRVAQTNRVKSPGVSTTMTTGPMVTNIVPANHATMNIVNVGGGVGKVVREEMAELDNRPPTPPWLRPPSTYKPKGKFAERTNKSEKGAAAATNKVPAAAHVASPAATSAAVAAPPVAAGLAAARRLQVQQPLPPPSIPSVPPPKPSIPSVPPSAHVEPGKSKVTEAIRRSGSSLSQLVQAANVADGEEIPRTESALEQLARTASAAKFVEDIVNGDSSLGETSSQEGKKLSQTTLQGSFEALMSMDVHSVENLLELASSSQSSVLLSELANKGGTGRYPAPSSNDDEAPAAKSNNLKSSSSVNLSSRMESFIKSLSSANLLKSGLDSGVALGSLLNATSSNSIYDAAEKISKRIESSTGFTQLRAEDGLANGTHNSVEDFLSLVASGDIPHQDPNMLNVPLQKVMQSQNGAAATTGMVASASKVGFTGLKGTGKRKFSQQHLVALASRLAGGPSSANLSDMTCGGSALKKRRKK